MAECERGKPFVLEKHFHIDYARFFNYPTTEANSKPSMVSTASPPCASLKPLSKLMRHRQRGGTWLSYGGSSPASLLVFTSFITSQPQLALVISYRHNIHEEHFISKLHFSWPQISCASQSSTRGGRVVFASYNGSAGQTQKFAMRFLSSSESQAFVNLLKEYMKGIKSIEIASTNGVETQSPPQSLDMLIPSDEMCPRMEVDISHKIPASSHPLELDDQLKSGPITFNLGQRSVVDDYEGVATVPLSFTSLSNCHTEAQTEPPKVPKPKATELTSHDVKLMTTASFHDMLSTVENVLSHIGGDLDIL